MSPLEEKTISSKLKEFSALFTVWSRFPTVHPCPKGALQPCMPRRNAF
jgi:hypothetical protein